jgi:hypothetical protein
MILESVRVQAGSLEIESDCTIVVDCLGSCEGGKLRSCDNQAASLSNALPSLLVCVVSTDVDVYLLPC